MYPWNDFYVDQVRRKAYNRDDSYAIVVKIYYKNKIKSDIKCIGLDCPIVLHLEEQTDRCIYSCSNIHYVSKSLSYLYILLGLLIREISIKSNNFGITFRHISINNTIGVYQTYCIDSLYGKQFNAQKFRWNWKSSRKHKTFKSQFYCQISVQQIYDHFIYYRGMLIVS